MHGNDSTMALAASIPRSLWGVYLRASQAFPLALIRREQDNKTQNNTTTRQATEKNDNNLTVNGFAAGIVHGIQIRRVFVLFFFREKLM